MDTLSVDTKLLKEIPHDEKMEVYSCFIRTELYYEAVIEISVRLPRLTQYEAYGKLV